MTSWLHTGKISVFQFHRGAVNVEFLSIVKELMWESPDNGLSVCCLLYNFFAGKLGERLKIFF